MVMTPGTGLPATPAPGHPIQPNLPTVTPLDDGPLTLASIIDACGLGVASAPSAALDSESIIASTLAALDAGSSAGPSTATRPDGTELDLSVLRRAASHVNVADIISRSLDAVRTYELPVVPPLLAGAAPSSGHMLRLPLFKDIDVGGRARGKRGGLRGHAARTAASSTATATATSATAAATADGPSGTAKEPAPGALDAGATTPPLGRENQTQDQDQDQADADADADADAEAEAEAEGDVPVSHREWPGVTHDLAHVILQDSPKVPPFISHPHLDAYRAFLTEHGCGCAACKPRLPQGASLEQQLSAAIAALSATHDVEVAHAASEHVRDRFPRGNARRKRANFTLDLRCHDKLDRLFRLRPVWTRRSLCACLSGEDTNTNRLRRLLPHHCFVFNKGPFRRCLVRLGYDPRRHVEAALLQVIDFRLSGRAVDGLSTLLKKLEQGGLQATTGLPALPSAPVPAALQSHEVGPLPLVLPPSLSDGSRGLIIAPSNTGDILDLCQLLGREPLASTTSIATVAAAAATAVTTQDSEPEPEPEPEGDKADVGEASGAPNDEEMDGVPSLPKPVMASLPLFPSQSTARDAARIVASTGQFKYELQRQTLMQIADFVFPSLQHRAAEAYSRLFSDYAKRLTAADRQRARQAAADAAAGDIRTPAGTPRASTATLMPHSLSMGAPALGALGALGALAAPGTPRSSAFTPISSIAGPPSVHPSPSGYRRPTAASDDAACGPLGLSLSLSSAATLSMSHAEYGWWNSDDVAFFRRTLRRAVEDAVSLVSAAIRGDLAAEQAAQGGELCTDAGSVAVLAYEQLHERLPEIHRVSSCPPGFLAASAAAERMREEHGIPLGQELPLLP
jgi:hypothetical protein